MTELLRLTEVAVNPRARWPAQVFGSEYRSFHFLAFTRFSGRNFWRLLQHLGTWSGDAEAAVASYGEESTGSANGIRAVSLQDDWEAYYACLEGAGVSLTGQGFDLMHAYVLSWVPPSLRWAMWGERMCSLLVLGFRGEPPAELEQWAKECGIRLWSIEEALESLTRLDFGIYTTPTYKPRPEDLAAFNAFKEEFLRNYNR